MGPGAGEPSRRLLIGCAVAGAILVLLVLAGLAGVGPLAA